MAVDLNSFVKKITITQSRIDAVVVLGATTYGVTINPNKEGLDPVRNAVTTLSDALVALAKTDIAEHLEDDLSATTRRSLTS